MDLPLTAAAPALSSYPAPHYCLDNIIRAHSLADAVDGMLLDRGRNPSVLQSVSISKKAPYRLLAKTLDKVQQRCPGKISNPVTNIARDENEAALIQFR